LSVATGAEAFEILLAKANPELRPPCWALRRTITDLHRAYVEVIWMRQGIASYGLGPKKMSEHYCYIAVHAKHLNLGFYHGTALKDPSRLLEGSGKKLFHVKIRDLQSAIDPALRLLLEQAIAERKRNATNIRRRS
jgi:hypothetical protein